VEGAARLADAARRLDLADRYLNCVAAKALFRSGNVRQQPPTASAASAVLCCRHGPVWLSLHPASQPPPTPCLDILHFSFISLPACLPLQTELGEATAALFTRDGEQANNLFEMQAVWYEVSSGRAYLKQQQYGKVGRGRGALLLAWHCAAPQHNNQSSAPPTCCGSPAPPLSCPPAPLLTPPAFHSHPFLCFASLPTPSVPPLCRP
jgi:hypothetical protein